MGGLGSLKGGFAIRGWERVIAMDEGYQKSLSNELKSQESERVFKGCNNEVDDSRPAAGRGFVIVRKEGERGSCGGRTSCSHIYSSHDHHGHICRSY